MTHHFEMLSSASVPSHHESDSAYMALTNFAAEIRTATERVLVILDGFFI